MLDSILETIDNAYEIAGRCSPFGMREAGKAFVEGAKSLLKAVDRYDRHLNTSIADVHEAMVEFASRARIYHASHSGARVCGLAKDDNNEANQVRTIVAQNIAASGLLKINRAGTQISLLDPERRLNEIYSTRELTSSGYRAFRARQKGVSVSGKLVPLELV